MRKSSQRMAGGELYAWTKTVVKALAFFLSFLKKSARLS